MSCILHTIGANVTFHKDVSWLNESTGIRGSVSNGEEAIVKSIDKKNHKLTVEIKSTGRRIIVDASVFGPGKTHKH